MPAALLGPAEVRELAARLGVRPTKTLGQNFVIDANTVRRIVRTADLDADDVVVEVGPGLGSLTLGLLPEVAARDRGRDRPGARRRAARNRRAPRAGVRRPAHGRHRRRAAARRRCPVRRPPRSSRTCRTTSPSRCCCTCSSSFGSVRRVLVMVQAEVADRLAAPPGSRTYGVPSVKAAWYADVRRAGAVGRTVFWPAPNVDSGLVALTRREPPATTASRRRGVRGRRRGVRPAAQDAARRAGRLGRVGAGRRDGAARRRRRPAARGEALGVDDFARLAAHRPTRPPRVGPMTTSLRSRATRSRLRGEPDGLGDRPGAGEGQPRPLGRGPAAPTASTTSPRCTTPSRSTTRSSPPTSDELSVSVTTADGVPLDDVPQDRSNLAVAAALALAEHVGVEPRCSCTSPSGSRSAGGMAGGSADAAAALVACDALWETGLSRAELLEIAAGLGSDVPFSLVGGTALGTGRGEVLTPVLARGRFEWVVAIAEDGLSTPAVYAECDRLRGDQVLPEPRVPDDLMAALRTGDATALGAALHNDLQEAACSLRPALRQTLETGEAAGALGGIVSGSGPTVVFLAREPGARPGHRGRAQRHRHLPVGTPGARPGRRRPAARRGLSGPQPRQPRGRRQGLRHPRPARRRLARRRRGRPHRRRRPQRRRQVDAAAAADPAGAAGHRPGDPRRRAAGRAGRAARRARPGGDGALAGRRGRARRTSGPRTRGRATC